MGKNSVLDLDDLEGQLAERKQSIETLCKNAFKQRLTTDAILVGLSEAIRSSDRSFSIPIFDPEQISDIEQTQSNILGHIEESIFFGELRSYFKGYRTFKVSLDIYKASEDDNCAESDGILIKFSLDHSGQMRASNDIFRSRRNAKQHELEQTQQYARSLIEQRTTKEKFLQAVGCLPPIQVPLLLENYDASQTPLDPHPEFSNHESEGDFTLFDPTIYDSLPLDQKSLFDFQQQVIEELFFEFFSYDALKGKILDAATDADPEKENFSVELKIANKGGYRTKSHPAYEAIARAFGGYSENGSASHDNCNAKTIESFRPDSFAAKLYSALMHVNRIKAVELGSTIKVTIANPNYQPKNGLSIEMQDAASAKPQAMPATGNLIQERINRFDDVVKAFKTITRQVEGFTPDTDKLDQLAENYRGKLQGTDTILYSQNMQSAVFQLEHMTQTLGIINGDIEAERIEQLTLLQIDQIQEIYDSTIELLESGIAKLDAFYMDERTAILGALQQSVEIAKTRAQVAEQRLG